MCEPKSLNAGEIENTLELQLLLVNEISKKQKKNLQSGRHVAVTSFSSVVFWL
jgi:hypothetical protein